MMTGKNCISAGLMFFELREFDIVDVANRLTSNLEALDQRVANVYIVSEQCAVVTTSDYQLKLALEDGARFETFDRLVKSYMSLSIRDVKNGQSSETSKKTVLVKSLRTLHRSLEPDFIKWIGDGVFISSDQFLMATRAAPVSGTHERARQRITVTRKRLPEVELANELLQDELIVREARRTDDMQLAKRLRPALDQIDPKKLSEIQSAIREDRPILRLSAWFLSIAVALIALPVGAALLVFTLLRGENLRLASQTAAVTGTFVAFQALGTTAQAMTAIQGILR